VIVKTLTLENIGLFRGMNEFRLAGPESDGARPMAAIAGKNGVGKSTLFRAAPLALHGAQAIGDRIAQREYAAFLGDLLHRSIAQDGRKEVSRRGRITVDLEYVRSGRRFNASVTRSFRLQGGRVTEELTVDSPEVGFALHDPQAWINDLVSPSVVPVWLFDAEDLGRLLGAEHRAEHLRRTLLRLLGVHLTERLETDLQHFVVKSGGATMEPMRARLLESQTALERAMKNRTELESRVAHTRLRRTEASQALRELESALAAEGGVYSQLRSTRAAEEARLKERITALEHRLRSECDGLLPIAVSRTVLARLAGRLAAEADSDRGARDWFGYIEAAFEQPAVVEFLEAQTKAGRDVAAMLRALLLAKASESREASSANASTPTPHDLSSSERRQLTAWIGAAGDPYREQLQTVAAELTELREQLRRVQADLSRAPDEAALAALHERIREAASAVATVEEEERALLREEGELAKVIEDRQRVFERYKKEFESAQRHERGVDLAARSRNVMTVFREALVRQKLEQLETAVEKNFNVACRKQHLLSSVSIDPESFVIDLRGYRGHPLQLEDFSAGERQLFNMALFKAMREITGLELPFFVDTPFARLDGTHRRRIVEDFFPTMENQVVLFMTDVESRVLTDERPVPGLHHAFWLEVDGPRQATSVDFLAIDELASRVSAGSVAA